MWPLVFLGGALGAVAYMVTRPRIDAPTEAPSSRGFMVTWDSSGSDHWYPTMKAVADEAKRLKDGGVVTRVSGTFVGHIGQNGRVTKG
jgi:hypothetical protein